MVDFFVRVIIGSHHQLGEFDEVRGKEAFPRLRAGTVVFLFAVYSFDDHGSALMVQLDDCLRMVALYGFGEKDLQDLVFTSILKRKLVRPVRRFFKPSATSIVLVQDQTRGCYAKLHKVSRSMRPSWMVRGLAAVVDASKREDRILGLAT
jgi:hypothetical protein